MPSPLYDPDAPLTVPTPPKVPTLIGLAYAPVELELSVDTPPPESSPVAAPVACTVVLSMVRSYWSCDCQVVATVLAEPSAAVVVCVCEPVSLAVSVAVRVKVYWPPSSAATKV